VKVEKE